MKWVLKKHKRSLLEVAVLLTLLIVIWKQKQSPKLEAPQLTFEESAVPKFDTELLAYLNQSTFERGDSLYVFLAANRGRNLSKELQIQDLSTGKIVMRHQLPARLIPIETCNSYSVGCDFSTRIELSTQPFKPGIYEIKAVTQKGEVSNGVFFCVREPVERRSKRPRVAVIFPTFTWQAYNAIGGASLYHPLNSQSMFSVSLRRPVTASSGPHWRGSSVIFVKLLRQWGYEVDAIDSLELHKNPEALKRDDLLLLTSHDEYWSEDMRQRVNDFLDSGHSMVVAAGNVMWWRVNVNGTSIYVNKGNSAPPREYFKTGKWFQFKALQEERVTGMSYRFAGYPLHRQLTLEEALKDGVTKDEYEKADGMQVALANHPVFRDTGLKNGDYFGEKSELLSVELDGYPLEAKELKKYRGEDHPDVLAQNYAASSHREVRKTGLMVALRKPSGARVIHLGSIGWFICLERKDPNCEKILKNSLEWVLER